MPTNECKLLLDTCGPDIYSRNAFRLLGTNVDQTGRRIKRQEKELQAAIEVDELADEYSGALRPDPLPTREELSRAARELTDAQQRFICEFFWFWPLEWGKSASDEVLNLLEASKVNEAQKRWTQIAADGGNDSLVARHNLAVLGHWLALDRERKILASTDNGKLTSEQRQKIIGYWNFAFKHWEPLCEDESFWSMQADRIRALDDPRLTTGFLRRFSQSLPIAFDNINADLAVAYCDREMYARAKDHVQIMKATNAGSDDVDASLRRVTEPLQGRIDHAIETATSQLVHNKTEGKQRCTELFDTVRSILNVLQTLLGGESPEYIETCDRVAESMLQCQVVYGNETEDWTTSVTLLEASLKVARGDKARARIEENLEIVKRNISLGLCWFCQGNKPQSGSEIEKKMHKKLYLSDIASGNFPELARQLQQALQQNPFADVSQLAGKVLGAQTITVTIPRCPECKKVHGTGAAISHGCGWPTGILLAVISAWIWDGWAAFIAGTIGLFAGLGIWMGIGASYLSSENVEGVAHWKKHPSVEELLKEGWEEGEPPTSG